MSAPTPGRLRSRAWFDNRANIDMTALYLERYLNFGLSLEELRSGRPIIGIAQTGSDLSPCNRHHLVLAERVRDGIREMGGIAARVPGPSDPGNRQAADRGARPQPRLSRSGRGALRLSDRRRGADDRLRQDHARLPDGGGDGEHPGDRAVGRADAERLAQGRAHRVGHHRVEGARDAGRRRDRRRRLHQAGGLVGAVDRLLQHDGHGDDDEQPGRSARHVAARLGGDSRALSRPAGSRLSHRQAHRRDGGRGPEAVRHPDPRRVPQRDRRQLGDRRIDQRADPPGGHRPPHRRRPAAQGLGDGRAPGAAAGQPAAGRRISGRGLLSGRRRAGGGGPADDRGADPRGRDHRERPDARRQLPRGGDPRRTRHPPVRSPAGRGRRVPGAAAAICSTPRS